MKKTYLVTFQIKTRVTVETEGKTKEEIDEEAIKLGTSEIIYNTEECMTDRLNENNVEDIREDI